MRLGLQSLRPPGRTPSRVRKMRQKRLDFELYGVTESYQHQQLSKNGLYSKWLRFWRVWPLLAKFWGSRSLMMSRTAQKAAGE